MWRPIVMVIVSWSDYLVGAHNKAGLLRLLLHYFQDSSPRWLSPWLIKWWPLVKYLYLRPETSPSPSSLESSPFSRIEGNKRSEVGGGRDSEYHQHLLTNDLTSQLLFHLLVLLDLLMISDTDSHLTEVRSLGYSFFWEEGNWIIDIQPQTRISEIWEQEVI